jgi:hypothetical protein
MLDRTTIAKSSGRKLKRRKTKRQASQNSEAFRTMQSKSPRQLFRGEIKNMGSTAY